MTEELWEVLLLASIAFASPLLGKLAGFAQPLSRLLVGFVFLIGLWALVFWSISILSIPSVSTGLLFLAMSGLVVVMLLPKEWANRDYWKAVLLGVAFGVVAFVSKHLLRIGERFHEDSIYIVWHALTDFSFFEMSDNVKRGFLYPLLLSMGFGDSLFISLTPLVFIFLVALTLAVARDLTRDLVSLNQFTVLAGVLAVLAGSIPIVQIMVFYLNSHTLIALGVGFIVAGVLFSQRGYTIDRQVIALLLIGGLVTTWSRYEGFLIALLMLLPFLALVEARSRHDRAVVFAVVLAPAVWWAMWSSRSGLPFDFFPRFTEWALVAAFAIALALVLLPALDRFRGILIPVGIFVVTAMAGVLVWLDYNKVPDQIMNIFMGLGGWGFAAPGFLLVLFLVGIRLRSRTYRLLLVWVFLAIIGTIALKLLDGTSLGRRGFNDSMNRAWMHWFVPFSVTVLRGVSEMVALATKSGQNRLTPPKLKTRI